MRRRALAVVLLAACGSQQPPAANPPSPRPTEVLPTPAAVEPTSASATKTIKSTTLAAVGLDPTALDRTADPCEDFYQFACGGWIARTEIPADKPMAMRTFVDIEDRNQAYLKNMLEKARVNPGDDPLLKQAGAFYASCMDEAAREKAGLRPIQPLLAAIAKVRDTKTLSTAIAALHVSGQSAVFGVAPQEDFANAAQTIARIDQAGLGLPDRNLYLTDDESSKALRAAYAEYAAAMLVEAGHTKSAAKTEAAEVLALETEIAKVTKSIDPNTDATALNHKIDRAGVEKAMPHFEWGAFWKTLGLSQVKDVTVTVPEFLAGVDGLVVKTKPAVWRNYLTVHTLGSHADILNKRVKNIRLALETKQGQTDQLPAEKRCIQYTAEALGDVLGQLYVRDRFAGSSKTVADELVKAIVAALNQNLDTVTWMDAATRMKAHEKVSTLITQVGHPEHWRTYTFKVEPTSFAANVLAARRFAVTNALAKIGKPTNRDEWNVFVPSITSAENPLQNKVTFSAGLLQPPFFSTTHSLAVNFGGVGRMVGHELTHVFDDNGAKVDGAGNVTTWWQPETAKRYAQRMQCVIDQYSKYEIRGTKVNGTLTARENSADISGVRLALAAFRTLRASAPETEVADGFTEEQQFFLAVGQTSCWKVRPDFESMLLASDVHAPMKWHVNGSLSATPDFAKAFRCKAGAKLRPADVCRVW